MANWYKISPQCGCPKINQSLFCIGYVRMISHTSMYVIHKQMTEKRELRSVLGRNDVTR